MAKHDLEYNRVVNSILETGVTKSDRTGTGTISVFGTRMEFDLTDNKIPLLTTKKVFHKGIIHELIWMLSGDTNIRYLKENGVGIWDSWIVPGTEEYRYYSFEERDKLADKIMAGNETYRKVKERIQRDHVDNYQETMMEYWSQNDVPSRELIAGELNKIYQTQWRKWDDTRIVSTQEAVKLIQKGFEYKGLVQDGAVVQRKIDQISKVIDRLKTNPDCRRIIVSAWNVAEIDEMSLAPCHAMVQFYTRELTMSERLNIYRGDEVFKMPEGFMDIVDKYDLKFEKPHDLFKDDYALINRSGDQFYEHKNVSIEQHALLDNLNVPRRALSSQLYQRSCDMPLGNCFNIVQYALLTHMVAQCVNMVAERFVWVGGDSHVYSDQIEGITEHMSREPLDQEPKVRLNPDIKNIFDFKFEDINVEGYDPLGPIKFPAAAV